MPVELILAPRWFPIHLSKMSYWARTVIVPLLVLAALQPAARNPRGILVDELFTAAACSPRWRRPTEPLWPSILRRARRRAQGRPTASGRRRLRQRAIDACLAFVRERLNGEDGLGAIYPAMANSVMMFDALGYRPERSRPRDRAALGREAARPSRDGEAYCQPCVSPIWDTALAAHAMLEVGRAGGRDAAPSPALDWLKPRQVLDVEGDWADSGPSCAPAAGRSSTATPIIPTSTTPPSS